MDNLTNISFIGIGTEKGGSTWVANMLTKHPEICMSDPKEITYFNTTSSFRNNYINPNKDKSYIWYNNHFTHCKSNQIKGEFSTGYLHDPDAAYNIYKHFPHSKLIICLRNPIDRAYSQYWMFRNYFKDEYRSTFEEAINKEPHYLEKGLYFHHLSRFLQYFKTDQIHIILLEDIKENPKQVLKDLYHFLGVDSNFTPKSIFEKSNSAKTTRFKFMIKVMDKISNLLLKYRLGWLLHIMKKAGIKRLLMKINSKSYSYPSMRQKTRKNLQKYFANDIYSLQKFLNRDLSHWQ